MGMLLLIFLAAFAIFCLQIAQHIRHIRRAHPVCLKKHEIGPRFKHTLKMAFGQSRVRERWWGICHTVIFYAFLVFLTSTVELLIQSVCPQWQLRSWLSEDGAALVHLIQTYFAWMTITALIVVGIRRKIHKNQIHQTAEAWAILGLILGIMMAHLVVMAANIALGHETAWLQTLLPLTTYLGHCLESHTQTALSWGSALHILCVAAFLVWIPRGKHLHIVFSFPSLFMQYRAYHSNHPILGCDTPDLAQYEAELEAALEKDLPESEWPVLGAEILPQLSQKQCLNAYACTQCQRCTHACPMVGAQLEHCHGPMQSMLQLRKLCAQKSENSVRLVADDDPQNGMMQTDELWNCTQCGACDRACPVGIEHTVRIVDLRRAAVCREQMPAKLHTVFAAQERGGNPWGYPKAKRMDWAKNMTTDHGMPQNPHTKVLLFAGCQAAYDPAATALLQKLANWLTEHGFAVHTLQQEMCCGEPMRKLGHETAFAECKKHNLEQIAQVPHDIILTTCPHCAHTLKHEYADDHTQLHVMHALEFLSEQWAAKKLQLPDSKLQNAVFHMPCGLGKQPAECQNPNVLPLIQALGLTLPEQDVTQAHCCGAGGGQFFLETSKPMANQRANELLQSNPETILTACPFCIQMISDAVSTKSETPPKTQNILEWLLK